jgi:ATP adenylyltransferase
MMFLSQLSVLALKKVLKPQGFNVGINLEKVAGAGVAGHLHIHIVPRWTGDTNFMPILGKTKVLSIDINQTYAKLKKIFAKVK